jgi:C4-dicarboxylate-binding protein DctP
MKKNILSACFVAAVSFASSLSAAPIEIKFSHVVADDTPKGQMALKFKELAEERLPGRVEVKVYPNSQLFTDNKVLEAMLLGDVQMAAPSLSKFESYTPRLQIYDLPFLFRDMEAVERFQQGPVGQGMLTSMADKGLFGLGYLHNGLKQLSASEPLRVPSDAAGKKFRIQASDVLRAQFEAIDAVALKKPFSEVFTLLQTRAIDGQENTWSNIYSQNFYEVQPYITESNHGVIDYMVVTSTEFWEGLDEEVRLELKRSLDEALVYGNNLAEEIAERDKQNIIDSKRSKVIELSDEERQQWVDAMKPVWNSFADDIGHDALEAAELANSNQ